MHFARQRSKSNKRWSAKARVALTALMIDVSLSACGATGQEVTPEIVLTYAENQTANYPTTQGAEYFAQLVRERTGGRIDVQIYADAQLGDETSVAQQLCFGGIDMMRCSLATVTNYSDMATVLMMPYLYDSADQMWKVLDGDIGQTVMQSFEGSGLYPLSWYDAGVRNFYMTEPLYTLEDLQGKRVRVQNSELMEDLILQLGATPMMVNYEDVYATLQRGQVDGAENNWPSYETMRHYLVAPYFIVDEHMRVPEMQVISEVTLQKLSEEDLQIIQECAKESALRERQLWKEREQTARETVLAKGCTEIVPEPAERQKLKDACAPLYEKYCSKYMDLIDRIREIQ